jgi:hypothetical protein
MSQPLTDPSTEPDETPEPEPFEPSVTNPDADGIDEPS